MLDTNKIIDKLAPVIVETVGDNSSRSIVKTYKSLDGENHISDLLVTADKFTNICSHIKNFDEIFVKYITMLNTVAPKRWHERFRAYAISYFMNCTEWDIDSKKEVEKCFTELQKMVEKNKNGFMALLDYSAKQISDYLGSNKVQKFQASWEKVTQEEMVELTKKIPVKLQNVKLYHGTSYDNYLRIKHDGYIKTTDYTDGTYSNDNIAFRYKNESGYVFTSDSLDFPISFCFGGYRNNSISWAYKESKEKERKNTDIGVVFEIDSTKYEIFYYPNKGESEFLIKGNVNLKDTKVIFYDFNGGSIKQITEEEANAAAAEGGKVK